MKKAGFLTLALVFIAAASAEAACPIADAGSSRYAGADPVQLDGTGSYDPDDSGVLGYQWQKISGPAVVITDSDTAMPTISGFVQTSEIQRCEFELIVNDGENDSLPDTVEVVIVPTFPGPQIGGSEVPFDVNKPTMIHLSWPDSSVYPWRGFFNNVSSSYYGTETYKEFANKLIVILSKEAPDYNQAIQTAGASAAGGVVLDIATYLNNTYNDPRYAVNRVTLQDGAGTSPSKATAFLNSRVGDEQCWIDNYISAIHTFLPGALNIKFPVPPATHFTPYHWYWTCSFEPSTWSTNMFNNGLTGGAYLSLIGPAKNLQLATNSSPYYFKWAGPVDGDGYISGPGILEFYNESSYPGRLPEPVTLVGPNDGDFVDANGVVLSCEVSQNVVGYQLLFGPDPQHMDYIISDTDEPPTQIITAFPFKETWWTIKVRDQYGSTIYADPICIGPEHITPPTRVIKNLTTGETYDHIQTAIDDAASDDEIVVSPDNYLYPENIDFKGKNLILRSTEPDDPAIVARTIINGGNQRPVVTFANGEDASCLLTGFTITNGNSGIYCSGVCPTITNCNIIENEGVGIEAQGTLGRSSATIINCTIAGNRGAGIYARARKTPTITNCIIIGNKGAGVDVDERATITNCTIVGNAASGISAYMATIANSIIWGNSSQQIVDDYNTCVVTHSNVQGGWSGDGNIDADPCFADADGPDNIIATEDDDLRLTPGSPCIDIGNNDVDTDPWLPGIQPLPETALDGRPRIIDGDCNDTDVIDMGAYEFNYAYIGDFDYQCDVDFEDFAILGLAWLTEPGDDSWDPHCDISIPADKSIDMLDLAVFADNWLTGH